MLWKAINYPLKLPKYVLCHYWQSNRYIKWHESALDCVRPEPPSVDYYGYQQTSQAILWDGLQKSRQVARGGSGKHGTGRWQLWEKMEILCLSHYW